ncbi:hypothetical protein OO013_04190 [Mangrovivirga sp. M17]|uniref:Nuclear transport factor 2 family protein n=1 Tax=Mangrovivirga halotolerans TaxID=2993936 RepID=A0ABT3RNV9_9BACT|nr:hypothetical protein [Mangrovivirga halotolerans]MCX2743049.1 hypothetical protein [Mangrovivirga halotolerans]
MKLKTLLISLFLIINLKGFAQDNDHVKSLDNIIKTLYSVISGEQGEARDWELFLELFHPNAKLIPTTGQQADTMAMYMTPEQYVERFGIRLVSNGFYEKEIHRITESFGHITHVFSTYESFHSSKDTEPFSRGINSIQLMNDGHRWWIINIFWQSENKENPLPEKYLPE